jgi:hypothetical protein
LAIATASISGGGQEPTFDVSVVKDLDVCLLASRELGGSADSDVGAEPDISAV